MPEPAQLSDLVCLGGGREAEIFAWDEGRVLRLARDPAHEGAVELEASALSAAKKAGAPVPALYERVRIDGRPGVVVERVDGEDLLGRLGRRPWSVLSVGRLLGRLHARLHRVAAPAELPRLRGLLASALQADAVPADVRERAASVLEGLPDGDRLYHGDFHPANVLAGPAGHYVIDWTNGASADPAADVARSCLILLASEMPADAPPVARRLDEAGRRLLLGAYLAAYRRENALDLRLVERWLRVFVAARLAEGIEGERANLLALAREHDGDDEVPRGLALPGVRPLPPPNRRWLVRNALAVTAVVNVVLNALPAWLSARGADEIPLWSARVGETNIIADTVGTFFVLPVVTCLLVTTAVWRELADGRLLPLGPGEDRVPFLRLLPGARIPRALALGVLCVAALGPIAVAVLVLTGFGPLSVAGFVAYKAALGVALGAVVTPAIAVCAMADRP
jgi:aminoglycoside phosphotransferase (APT) family kinase protein